MAVSIGFDPHRSKADHRKSGLASLPGDGSAGAPRSTGAPSIPRPDAFKAPGDDRELEKAVSALEDRIRTTRAVRPIDFLRLGLKIVVHREDSFILSGHVENRVEIRVQPAAFDPSDANASLCWDVHATWRAGRSRARHRASIDEWLGLPFIDAFALLRGLINEAVAESRGEGAVTDAFRHRGRLVLNPFRDAFGNETSPSSEYGDSYLVWRSRSPFPAD
ncbi:hypothetical protein KXR53_15220 [Inquilinus limosus]|uniref:hypothetical protein n=1 Tax=Inquilinus limosus TaxID=171674 RepID=UPI003F151089